MRHFTLSIFVTLLCLGLAFLWAVESGKPILTVMALITILGILEISLSFDNAVVNATVLKEMDERWQRYFLTWGILIAVFGMRLVFPVLIVAVTANLSPGAVITLALDSPEDYAAHLTASQVQVSAFGGMFLLLIFLTFVLDAGKTLHWLEGIEERLASIGKLESIEIVFALMALLLLQALLPEHQRAPALVYGVAGVMLYVLVDSLTKLLNPETGEAVKRNGAMGFVYLEILDASFSFDGVLGAFAITNDIVIIMLGLAIGAMYVRSLTVYLVKKGTLDEYAFLEHGAHYAIGALAVIMLASTMTHIPELITGLIGITLIGLSLFSSVMYNKRRKRRAA